MSQSAATLTTTWLTDEAILGLEPNSSAPDAPKSGPISGPDGFADAADADLMRDASSQPASARASEVHSDTKRASDATANPDATSANANEAPSAAPPTDAAKPDTSVTIHALPAATL